MEWGRLSASFRDGLLDTVFPRTCVQCGRFLYGVEAGVFTCEDCWRAYPLVKDPVCEQCGIPFYGKISHRRKCADCQATPPAFLQARSLFLYRETGARLVHCLKYERGSWLQPEATALIRSGSQWGDFFRHSVLVPVPLHFRKQQARGYNQAEIIARAIREAVPTATIDRCLRRIRATPSQTFLSREERRRNMKGAFSCVRPPGYSGRIILVDDVLTTGATLNAAVQALRVAGLGEIYAFTLAHG
jgi:ComF family protein